MKKAISVLASTVMVLVLFAQSAFALDSAPNMGGYSQDADGLAQCFSDYLEYYLPGVPETERNTVTQYVHDGYEKGDIQMMSLMTGYASVRKAGQAAEEAANQVNGTAPAIDVLNQYYSLTDDQKKAFADNLTASFSAIGLTAEIKDGAVIVTKGSDEFLKLTLVTEKPKSSTRIYLDAYLPSLSEEAKATVETLVSEYSAETGSPAGSGAVWRCIREIGEIMGVEAARNVDMEKGTMSVTVTKAGKASFKDCTAEEQAAIIAKADETMAAIGLTSEYKNGVYQVFKNGAERLSYTLTTQSFSSAPAAAEVPATGGSGFAALFGFTAVSALLAAASSGKKASRKA